MKQDKRTIHAGFTILELLVAMSITVLLLFLINRVFFDTVNAVGQGASLSQILASQRVISRQIDTDAQAMIGPTDGGFLVIINQKKKNVSVPRYFDEATKTWKDKRDIRSDQLVFFRRAEGLNPLAPARTNAFNNDVSGPYARVWYGHALRTDPDGTGPAAGGLGTGPNQVATNWILGRQALILAGSTGGSQIYVNGARYNSPISSFSGAPPASLRVAFMGLSDQSNWSLVNPPNNLTGTGGVLVGLNEVNYRDEAFKYAFPDSRSGEQRLRVNPVPAGTTFESWRIGQMHPLLAENVSDFVVEFVCDIRDNDGDGVCPDPGDEPDVDPAPGALDWIGMGHLLANQFNFANYPPNTGRPDPFQSISSNEKRWVFRHDEARFWPYLIRIRYRLHDPNARFESFVGDSSGQSESGQWYEQIIAVNRQ